MYNLVVNRHKTILNTTAIGAAELSNNKRVAIIFTGLVRRHQLTDYLWTKFIEEYQADVFVHTWNTEHDKIPSMLQAYNPVAYQIDEPVEIDQAQYISREYPGVSIYNIFSQWHSMKRGFNMMEAYYRSQSCLPDAVVRTRFDLVLDDIKIEFDQPLVIPMEPKKYPDCTHYKEQFLVPQADVFSYGSMDSMRKYCNTLDLIPKIFKDSDFAFTSENILISSLTEQRVPFINNLTKMRLIK